jgi:hypothetical protein
MRLGSGLDATAECEGRQGHFAYSARIDGDGSAVGAPRLESPRVEWGLGAVPLKWNFVSHGREWHFVPFKPNSPRAPPPAASRRIVPVRIAPIR